MSKRKKPIKRWSKKDRERLLGAPYKDLLKLWPEYTRVEIKRLRREAQALDDPPACPWDDQTRAELAQLPRKAVVARYKGQYPALRIQHWWTGIQEERAEKRRTFAKDPEALSAEEALLWVSKAELDRRKKQEYNRAMGLVHSELSGQPSTEPDADEKIATYLNKLADDEDQFITQRSARAVSLSAARELLLWKHIEHRINVVAANIQARPSGYARRKAPAVDSNRVLSLLWTDQHFGAKLPAEELPVGYMAVEERRRFAKVVFNALTYKEDHRAKTTCHIYDAGDNMEGFLGHDLMSGEPLADQFVTLLEYRIQATEHLAAQYPQVNVWVKPGNHDRNKMRHPGRATYQKWDSYQRMVGYAWQAACRHLPNVSFAWDKSPHAAVNVLGHWTFVTHGDTGFNLGNPGNSINIKNLERQITSINSTQRYGGPFKVFAAGHVHTSVQTRVAGVDLFINSALCPSSGYSDALGYTTDASQWMWETTEQHAVGDMRRVNVGPEDDKDSSLDEIIRPINLW